MKMNNYDIAAKAEKGRKKDRGERNGDCCSWIEENGCVVLALADGVGHCANDHEAAQTTCSQFIEKCRKARRRPPAASLSRNAGKPCKTATGWTNRNYAGFARKSIPS